MSGESQITVCVYVDDLLITTVDKYELTATVLDLKNIYKETTRDDIGFLHSGICLDGGVRQRFPR